MIDKGFKLGLSLAFTGLLYTAAVPASDLVVAGAATTTAISAKKARLIDLWQPGDTGQRMNIRGRVTSPDGTPLADIEVAIRQPDGDGYWLEQYRTTLKTDAQGRYQFGSVVPESNYCGAPHVQVTVYQDGYEYFDTNLLFASDMDMGAHQDEGTPVFLEESTVNGETIMFGRFDIELSPE